VTNSRKGAWFQPLNPSSENCFYKFSFTFNLYRYTTEAAGDTVSIQWRPPVTCSIRVDCENALGGAVQNVNCMQSTQCLRRLRSVYAVSTQCTHSLKAPRFKPSPLNNNGLV
jgi:hypothetical protein